MNAFNITLGTEALVQTLGLIACLIGIGSYLFNDSVNYKRGQTASSVLFAVQYACLDALSAASMQAINVIRGYFSINTDSTVFLFMLYGLYWSVGAYFYSEIKDILPLLAVTVGTFAIIKLKERSFRMVMLIPSAIWVLIGVVENSLGGIIMSSLIIGINTYKITITTAKGPVEN